MTMSMQNLEELFVEKLKDVYDAERRITKALPKMAKTANSEELSAAFEQHLQQTHGQIERLDRIFENLDMSPGRKQCHGMMGILEEGQEVMDEDFPEPVMDAALIAGAQEVEHYEISAYGTLRSWAELLGKKEEARLLQQTLDEESQTDEKLNALASKVNPRALEADGSEDDEDEERDMATAGTGSSRRSARSGGGSRRSSSSRRSR